MDGESDGPPWAPIPTVPLLRGETTRVSMPALASCRDPVGTAWRHFVYATGPALPTACPARPRLVAAGPRARDRQKSRAPRHRVARVPPRDRWRGARAVWKPTLRAAPEVITPPADLEAAGAR